MSIGTADFRILKPGFTQANGPDQSIFNINDSGTYQVALNDGTSGDELHIKDLLHLNASVTVDKGDTIFLDGNWTLQSDNAGHKTYTNGNSVVSIEGEGTIVTDAKEGQGGGGDRPVPG